MRKILTFLIPIQILDTMYIPVKVAEHYAQISYVIRFHRHTSDIDNLETKIQILQELVTMG